VAETAETQQFHWPENHHCHLAEFSKAVGLKKTETVVWFSCLKGHIRSLDQILILIQNDYSRSNLDKKFLIQPDPYLNTKHWLKFNIAIGLKHSNAIGQKRSTAISLSLRIAIDLKLSIDIGLKLSIAMGLELSVVIALKLSIAIGLKLSIAVGLKLCIAIGLKLSISVWSKT